MLISNIFFFCCFGRSQVLKGGVHWELSTNLLEEVDFREHGTPDLQGFLLQLVLMIMCMTIEYNESFN